MNFRNFFSMCIIVLIILQPLPPPKKRGGVWHFPKKDTAKESTTKERKIGKWGIAPLRALWVLNIELKKVHKFIVGRGVLTPLFYKLPTSPFQILSNPPPCHLQLPLLRLFLWLSR